MAKIGTIPQVVNDPSSSIDPGIFVFSCESIKEGDHKDQLIYDSVFRVQEPIAYKGQAHFERWFIGTDKDPEAILPETWTSKAGHMKKACDAMGVPFLGQNPDMIIQQMVGKLFCAKIVHKQTTKDGVTYTNARVVQYGQHGTMTPEVFVSDNGQSPVTAPIAPAPLPAGAPGVGTPVAPQTGMPASPAALQQGGQQAPLGPPLPPQHQ
ncbi:hypothetical protein LCGC14_0650290 [marine sediment metagenome]|uniref:Uncharacterized protein n=1 Tax=marine sediment metagenome TaxID=412755 RepID=A0A0F9QWH5_9ZZZZ|nr:hypothetical protein [Candidatus Aminicenantes bacterium]